VIRRVGVLIGLAVVAMLSTGPLVGAGEAWAHAGGLTSSSNEPVVLGIEPAVPGLDVSVVEAGARLRLKNGTPVRVVVMPTPGSVVNTLPVVAPGASAYWADPRVAFASAQPVPPSRRLAWTIPLRVGDEDVTVLGEQRWPPPPAASLWWLLLAAMVAIPSVVVAVSTRGTRGGGAGSRAGGSPAGARSQGAGSADLPGLKVARMVVAVSTLVVIIAHVVHIYGSALVPAQGEVIWLFLSAAGFAVVAWPIGLAGSYATMRGHQAGPLLCLVAGALIAVIISPADIFSFYDAVVPFAWGADLDRFLIALNVGGGLGVITAATILLRRTPDTEQPEHPEPAA
jgi:hypothetical protein